MNNQKRVLIFGATGNIGGAAARELLKQGWHVRAVTRTPDSGKAQDLKWLGAEIFQADMEDRVSVGLAFKGYERALSVQNWTTAGADGEIRQGKIVADAAKSAGIAHLVYTSAGTGDPHTGIPHFDSKIAVENHMRDLEIPFTILRPAPFMELLSEPEFYPALAAWGVEPGIVGWDKPIPWVSVRDLGVAVASMLSDPYTWIRKDIPLYGDVKTLAECRDIFLQVDGKKPRRIALPVWLFKKMAGEEFVLMWEWMQEYITQNDRHRLCEIVEASRALSPDLLDVQRWLEKKRNGGFYGA